MRQEWIKTLIEQARIKPNLYLLAGDVGYGLVEPFAQEFPDRFINCGIAEQNMIGVATGLAMSGKTVFVYSLANFPTFRCLEQIRNDVCYHHANVKIVCSGGGLSYGSLGMTHHTIQDLAIMRCLPNMTIVVPCDGVETTFATKAIINKEGACYLRLERDDEPVVHEPRFEYELGKAIKTIGSDITLIAIGGIVNNAIEASKILEHEGISVSVLDMHTLKPLDVMAIRETAIKTKHILTVEEHSIIGGLGSATAEVLVTLGLQVRFRRLGIEDCFCSEVGDQIYLRERCGLSVDNIAESAKILLRRPTRGI
jgi:transketolase